MKQNQSERHNELTNIGEIGSRTRIKKIRKVEEEDDH